MCCGCGRSSWECYGGFNRIVLALQPALFWEARTTISAVSHTPSIVITPGCHATDASQGQRASLAARGLKPSGWPVRLYLFELLEYNTHLHLAELHFWQVDTADNRALQLFVSLLQVVSRQAQQRRMKGSRHTRLHGCSPVESSECLCAFAFLALRSALPQSGVG